MRLQSGGEAPGGKVPTGESDDTSAEDCATLSGKAMVLWCAGLKCVGGAGGYTEDSVPYLLVGGLVMLTPLL